jgi:GNAT superfamily N-acetyltransferase
MDTRPKIDTAMPGDRDIVLSLILNQFSEHEIDVDERKLVDAIEAVLSDDNLGYFLLASEGDDPVGVAYVSLTWTLEHGGRSAWLEELYVVPERRNGGIGSALLTAVIDRAQQSGCAAIDLEVSQGQRRAEHLYGRNGFSRLSRSRWVVAIGHE